MFTNKKLQRGITYILTLMSEHSMISFLFIFTTLIFGSAEVIIKLEPENFTNYIDGIYWTMSTVATVGYGDLSPTTPEGKLFSIFLMIFGIMVHVFLIGKVVELFSIYKVKKRRGEIMYTKKNHYIVVYYSKKAKRFIKQLIADDKNVQVVLIDTMSESPITHPNVHYVKGLASRIDVLEAANIKHCKSVMIFSSMEYTNDLEAADGKNLLIASIIEANYPNVKTVVEIQDYKNRSGFIHAKVDQIIGGEDLSTKIGVLAVTNPESMKEIEELLNK